MFCKSDNHPQIALFTQTANEVCVISAVCG